MADTIIHVDPRILKVHPRNAEFFDDVNGAEFDRLVESIKDHGVLTPLRVTKDMTIISGHQRTRAAIEAECFSVPVIVDDSEDDNDVLMKLIETNFGRMKNNAVKQALWLAEYEKLRGVRQGSAGQADPQIVGGATQDDIAKELGISTETMRRLKSLLKLDPVLQSYISDGKIKASTGYNILTKLSPEEQAKLVDKLPDNVKFSAKSIEAHIEEVRQQLANKTNEVMQDNNKLLGEKERLIRENNELRANKTPSSDESRNREKIDKLEEDKRNYYEQTQRLKKETERLRGEIDKANQAKQLAEARANGGDEASIALENRISELEHLLEAQERKANDLEYQLSEKEDEIKELEAEKRDGVMRKALSPKLGSKEFTQRQKDALRSDIASAIGSFNTAVRGLLIEADSFSSIGKEELRSLVEMASESINFARQLSMSLMSAGGASETAGNEIEYDPDFEVDDSGLDFSLGA